MAFLADCRLNKSAMTEAARRNLTVEASFAKDPPVVDAQEASDAVPLIKSNGKCTQVLVFTHPWLSTAPRNMVDSSALTAIGAMATATRAVNAPRRLNC
jgi:hypothetical protein